MPECLSRHRRLFPHQSPEDASACAPRLKTELNDVLRSKVDELAPTPLPVEIMEYIFRILKPPPDLYDHRDTTCHHAKYVWNIKAVSQVCYQWRVITLGCTALWTYIAPLLFGYEWTREMLARSKGAPLTLDIRGFHMSRNHIINLAMGHLFHTRTLVIDGHFQDFLRRASGPAPLLESITIGSFLIPIAYIPIPYHTLVAFETPALRKLVLHDHITLSGASLSATMIENLRHLDIKSGRTCPMLPEFINIHQRLSSLQTLALDLIDDHGLLSVTIINLPRVTSIKLRGSLSNCSVLLPHIRAPCIEALALVCNSQTAVDFPNLLVVGTALLEQNATEIKAQHWLFTIYRYTTVFSDNHLYPYELDMWLGGKNTNAFRDVTDKPFQLQLHGGHVTPA